MQPTSATRVRSTIALVASLSGCVHASFVSQQTYAPTYVSQQETQTSVRIDANVGAGHAASDPAETAAPSAPDPSSDAAEDPDASRPAVRLIRPLSLGYLPVDLNQCVRHTCMAPSGGCRCLLPGQSLPREAGVRLR